MALATQCPHCNTTFRVAQDQLKLRAGLVRCGSCKEIFNGIEHLLRPESAAAPSPAASKPAETPAAKVVAESPAHASGHVTEPVIMEDAASAGIPISLLAKPVAPKVESKAELASAQLDFAYPDPLPETESEPEPNPEPVSEAEPVMEPQASAPDEPEEEQQEELEAHAAEAVEFVDFVDVPRKPKEPIEETYDIEDTQPEDPLTRMTLVDLSEGEAPDEPYMADIPLPEEAQAESAPEEPDPLDAVIDELKRKPLRSKKKKPKPYTRLPTQEAAPEEATPEPEIPDHEDEPEFVKQSRRDQTVGRTMRIAMGIGSFFLLVGALGQATYTFRDLIAAHVPETKPILADACLLLNCKVGLPTQIETISIESDQLETLNTNKDVSELTMLLRNVSSTSQTWPHLELTLNDANNTMLSRRVFSPQEYLPPSADEKKGFASNAEQPVKLDFEFTGTKPAGYHIGVFYP